MRIVDQTEDYIVFQDTNTVNAWMIYILTIFTMAFVAWFFLAYWSETGSDLSAQMITSLALVELSLLVIGIGTGSKAQKSIITTIDREYGNITIAEFRGRELVRSRTYDTSEIINVAVTTEREKSTQTFNPNQANRGRADYVAAPTQRLQTYSNTYGVVLTLGSGHEIRLTTRHRPHAWATVQHAVNESRYYMQEPVTGRKKRKK
ncbi:MAG: hypothetical protein AAFR56_05885 [Chloroflexota bacterium]